MIGLKPLISSGKFIEAVNAITAADSVNELSDIIHDLTIFDSGSYHHIPSIGSYDYNHKKKYWAYNLNDAVLNYIDKTGRKNDRIMQFIFSQAKPYWISDLLQEKDMSGKSEQDLINLALNTLGNGMLLPLFGPSQRRGYIYVKPTKSREYYDEGFIWQIQAMAQTAHVRYCTIVESLRDNIKLTNREAEVLELISYGKTNPEIGIILGISTNTVAGYLKRLFLKFDIQDRVTLAMRAQTFTL